MKGRQIAVIGAGPAGCAAAISATIHLGPNGPPAILFEAGAIDKDKPCGDALVADALQELRSYGIDDRTLRELGGTPYRAVTITKHGRNAVKRDLGPYGGWVVARSRLDARLRQAAARTCDLRLHSKITRIQPVAGRFRLWVAGAETVDVDGVVIASGAAKAFREFGLCQYGEAAVAMTQYSTSHSMPDALRFDFGRPLSREYVWWFPIDRVGANWGVWAPQADVSELFHQCRGRMLRLSRHPGYSKPRAAIARLWNGAPGIWHRPEGLIACGDAAGLIDPYTGEGISAALISGAQAGRSIAAFVDGSSTALTGYSEWVQSFFNALYSPTGSRALSWMELTQLPVSCFRAPVPHRPI